MPAGLLSRAWPSFLSLCLMGAPLLAAAGVVAGETPVRAAGAITALVIDGEPGDEVSGGRSIAASGSGLHVIEATVREPALPRGVDLHLEAAGQHWFVTLWAPQGSVMTAGAYAAAANPANVEPGQPALEIEKHWDECSATRGSFTVHEIETNGAELLAFAASFTQTCDDSTDWLHGEVRFNATLGYTAAEVRPSGKDFGRLEVKTRSETETFTVTSAGTSALHLGSAELIGDDATSFRIESDACSNVTLAPGESCSISASAMPLSTRAMSARIRITDDTYRGKRAIALDVLGFKDYAWGSVGTAARNYTWTGGEALGTTEGGTDRLQQVSVSPFVNGQWARDTGPYIGIYHARMDVMGSRWSTAKRINQSGMHGISPALATSGSAVYAVWVGVKKYVPYQPKSPRVLYFRANLKEGAAASWRYPVRLTSKTGRIDSPAIAADGSNVYVVWTNANSGKLWLAISRDSGKRWTQQQIATTRSKGTSGYYANPVIAADADHLIVAWWPRQDALMKVKVSTDGARSWSGAVDMGYSTWQPAVAAKGGRLAVAWPSDREFFVRTWEAGTWEPTRSVNTNAKKTFTPALVLRGEDAMALAYPLCTRYCGFRPSKATEASLKWRYSADRGASWTNAATLAKSVFKRSVNNQPSMVWPEGGRRAVLFDGWRPWRAIYRVYLVQGPTLDPSSAGFAIDPSAPTEPMPDYDEREPGGRSSG